MHFTKETNIPGIAVFLDFEKAFDSIEWNFIHKCLETFNFGLDLRQWIQISLVTFLITDMPQNIFI